MESLEERIARAVLRALRENQSVPQKRKRFTLLRDSPPNPPPLPSENHIATPLVSREEESSSMSSPRRLVHGEVDILKAYTHAERAVRANF